MNNYNIKNLRQAMLSIAAAALVSISFMACSDDTFMTPNTTAPADGYQICIPANIGGGDTRALTYNSETGGYDATFETTDGISIFQASQYSVLAYCLHPETNGKYANLVGKPQFYTTPVVGEELVLLYKAEKPEFYYSLDFSKGDIEVEYAFAIVTVESVDEGKITTSAATFQNPQSIFTINFTGINSDVKIKKMTISSAKKKLVNALYFNETTPNNNFGDVSYTYKEEGTAQRELTFMLRFASNQYGPQDVSDEVITFSAIGSDGHLYIGTRSVSNDLENSKYYHADVAMADIGVALTLTDDATGENVEIGQSIETKNAAYTLKNSGYNSTFWWFGGKNTLTLNGVTINNSSDTFLYVQTDYEDQDNTKEHYLVLNGENTVNSSENNPPALSVFENSTLNISASEGGKLILNGQGTNIGIYNNAKLTLESGEITVNGGLWINDGSYFVIKNSGKLRIKANYFESGVKAANGYKLITATDGDYKVYTVTAADAYEQPKALSTATTEDIGKIVGSDGKIHVPNWDLPEGVTPVAMIASISSTGHGLAVSIERVKTWHAINGGGWYNESFTWNNAGDNNNGKTATEIFNEWTTNNSVSFGTWHMPTVAEWQQMVLACRVNGDAAEVTDEMVAEGLVSKLKETGGFGNNLECWTGESNAEGLMITVGFSTWYWDSEKQESYQGPNKLAVNYTSAEHLNGRYSNILPVLEF